MSNPRPKLHSLIRKLVAQIDPLPNLDDVIVKDTDNDALIDAYLSVGIYPDVVEEWGTPEQRHADVKQLSDMINAMADGTPPEDPARLAKALMLDERRQGTRLMAERDIAYRIGVEIGRHLSKQDRFLLGG